MQKVFDALRIDQMNPALGIIYGELENQGHRVLIDNKPVHSGSFWENAYSELDEKIAPMKFTLIK